LNLRNDLGEEEQNMPKGNKTRAYYDQAKSFITADCGQALSGTQRAVLLKHRLHIQKCEVCKLLNATAMTKRDFQELPRKTGDFINVSKQDMKRPEAVDKKAREDNSKGSLSISFLKCE